MAAPIWLRGQDLAVFTVQPGTRSATDGSITWGTAISMLSVLSSVTFEDMRETEMIIPVTAVQAHYERTILNSSCTIVEILKRGGTVAAGTPQVPTATTGPILPLIAQGWDLVKVVATRGKAAGVGTSLTCQTYTYLGTISRFSDGHQNLGANTCSLTLVPINDGTNSAMTDVESAVA